MRSKRRSFSRFGWTKVGGRLTSPEYSHSHWLSFRGALHFPDAIVRHGRDSVDTNSRSGDHGLAPRINAADLKIGALVLIPPINSPYNRKSGIEEGAAERRLKMSRGADSHVSVEVRRRRLPKKRHKRAGVDRPRMSTALEVAVAGVCRIWMPEEIDHSVCQRRAVELRGVNRVSSNRVLFVSTQSDHQMPAVFLAPRMLVRLSSRVRIWAAWPS